MLAFAAGRDGHPSLVRGRAEALPFADGTFDHLTFTYLLRYVDDPPAVLRELYRVVRPGGTVASLEFGLPGGPLRLAWRLYTRIGLPLLGRAFSERWAAVGAFLGGSIERFHATYPEPAVVGMWTRAGLHDVSVRRMTFGAGVVITGRKVGSGPRGNEEHASVGSEGEPVGSAFYSLRPGGIRDYWTLLHPPYTAWHLSYVLLGAALAPSPDPRIVAGALLAFFLGVGVAAHSFDELRGRPLGTRIDARLLIAMGSVALAAAVALGVAAATALGPMFLAFVGVGAALVLLYAFEVPIVHSDIGFALAWGAFPVLTAAFATGAPIGPAAVAAIGAALLSLAQRMLSTPVRRLRRKAVSVEGEVRYRDGTAEPLGRASLIAAPERALRLLWLAVTAVAAGLLLARWWAA